MKTNQKLINVKWAGAFELLKSDRPVLTKPLPSPALLPISGMPSFIQEFIKVYAETYTTPRDYWAGAAIMATALGIGDKIQLNTKFKNVPILWMNIIGDVSSGKTEAQDLCIKPFEEMDSRAMEQFRKEYEKYQEIESLPYAQRKSQCVARIPKPKCFQYIVKDSTPEALSQVHAVNQRGFLISRDELKGMLDDYGRYGKSGEQSNMLSAYNRIRMVTNRKVGGGNCVHDISNPCILIVGGMQPEIIPLFGGDNRKENGFLARFCHVWPDHTEKPPYTRGTVPVSYFNQWTQFLIGLTHIEHQLNVTLSHEAEVLYEQWYNLNVEISNKEESGYLKGVYGKLDIMALRLAVVLFGMNHCNNLTVLHEIQVTEMQAAIDITEYFKWTALKVHQKLFGEQKDIDTKKVIRYLSAKNHTQTRIAHIIGSSQSYVNKILNE